MPRYCRPTNLAGVLATLAEEGDGAHLLVGGTDLLIAYRHLDIEPRVFVDLKGADDLPEPIVVDDDGIQVGPTLTMRQVADHPQVRAWYPALVEAARVVGSIAIRNRATLVGNICNASPAADTAPALLAHRATVTLASLEGERTVPLADFFLGPRSTRCEPGDIVVRIDLPRPEQRSSSAFERLTRRRGVDLASVSVAARVDDDGSVTLGLGAVAPRPLVSGPGRPVDARDDAAVASVVDELVAVATPISDVRANQDYRTAMLRVLTTRAIRTAAGRRTTKELVP